MMLQLSSSALDYLKGILGRAGDPAQLTRHIDDLVQLQNTLQGLVEQDLERLLQDIPGRAGDATRHLLSAGGKRLRPVMALLAAGASGERPEKALPVAAAVELLHTGSLLHDDVIDEGEMRRGLPASRRIYGNPVAVIGGDFCLFSALDALLRLRDYPLLERAMRVAHELTEAELWQLDRRAHPSLQTETGYYGIIERKTGSLFGLATYGGARCAWAPDASTNALDAYGRKIGIAFQIVDDILDLAGDAAVVGKAMGQDLAQGTITLPVIYAVEENPDVAMAIEGLLSAVAEGREPDSLHEAVVHIVEGVRATQGIARARERAEAWTQDALAQLEQLPPTPYRETLTLLGVSLIDRVR